MGELWESPLSLQLGGEVVAGVEGEENSVEGKKSALDRDRKEELGAG